MKRGKNNVEMSSHILDFLMVFHEITHVIVDSFNIGNFYALHLRLQCFRCLLHRFHLKKTGTLWNVAESTKILPERWNLSLTLAQMTPAPY